MIFELDKGRASEGEKDDSRAEKKEKSF